MAEEKQRERDPERGLFAAVAAARGIRPDPARSELYEMPLKTGPSKSGPWAWLRLPWRGLRN